MSKRPGRNQKGLEVGVENVVPPFLLCQGTQQHKLEMLGLFVMALPWPYSLQLSLVVPRFLAPYSES